MKQFIILFTLKISEDKTYLPWICTLKISQMFKNLKAKEEGLYGNQLTYDIINVYIVYTFYSVIHARWKNVSLYA
jgi:hypothetical protein